MGHLSTPCTRKNYPTIVHFTSIRERETKEKELCVDQNQTMFASSSLRSRLRSPRPSSTSRSISARIRGLSRNRVTEAAIFLRAPWKSKFLIVLVEKVRMVTFVTHKAFLWFRPKEPKGHLCHTHLLQLLLIEGEQLAITERHHNVGVPAQIRGLWGCIPWQPVLLYQILIYLSSL